VLRVTPDMDVVSTDEKNVRRAIRTGVGDALRNHYGDVLKEAIPTRLTEPLEQLDEPQRETGLVSVRLEIKSSSEIPEPSNPAQA
jgi:hypothetical protein